MSDAGCGLAAASAARGTKRRPLMKVAALAFVISVASASAQVIVNEIMFHPYEPWPPTQPAKTTNNSEYIEIYNVGVAAVDLSQYRFDNGVTYNFPPGTLLGPTSYLVVCGNVQAFTSYYPSVRNYVGGFGGALNNGGERVTLSRFDGTNWVTADTIEYVDGGPADGDGPSLELIHPGFARLRDQYYADWAPSTTTNGTPGYANSVYAASPLPVVGAVGQSPPLPPANSMVTFTCRATGRDSDALSSVVLNYRKDALPAIAWSQTNMNDSGVNGDAMAGDGVYTLRLPPAGQPGWQSGDLLEFTITATDVTGSRTFPATNTSGVLSGPYSYLCYFGDDDYSDCAYRGEYPTYHILMTKANRQVLETRDVQSDDTLDAALVTHEGEVIYNCGARYRGGSSRGGTKPYIPYRVDLPRGRRVDGYRELNFNNDNGMSQFMGMTIMANAGYGCSASDAALSRLWLNETHLSPGVNQQLYVRVEGFDDDFVARRYPSNDGNRYASDGDVADGDLRWFANLSDYQQTNSTWADGRGYFVDTNNPYTAWHELTNFTSILNQDVSLYPQILTNRMNVREWARFYAGMVCIDNGEAGYGCPYNAYGDELRLYCDSADGQFDIFPWDLSNILGSTNARVWQWNDITGGTVTKFLFNPPVLPYYAGDCLDIMDTVMSQSNMVAMIDGMGSKAVSYKTGWTNTVAGQRAQLRARIATDFTVNVNGAPVLLPFLSVPRAAVDMYYPVNDVNQQTNGWVYLGSYDFSASGSEYVRVASDDESLLCTVADAVMFSNATAVVIVDNTDARFAVTGSWGTYDSGGYNNTSYRNSTAADSTATWTPLLPAAGAYAVYAWCVTPVGRYPSDPMAEYTIMANQMLPLASFSGRAPQAYTARVLVNGQAVSWNLMTNGWQTTNAMVLPGKINPVTIEARNSENGVLRSTNLVLVTLDRPQHKTGTISSNTVWDSTSGTIVVDGDVSIASSATLTVSNGAVVVFAQNARLLVGAGTLNLQGTADNPVYLFPSNGASLWSVNAAGAGAVVTGRWVVAAGGQWSLSAGARLTLQDATLACGTPTNDVLTATNAAWVSLSRCIVSNFSRTVFDQTPALIEDSLFTAIGQCGAEFRNAGATAVVSRTTFEQSAGAAADGVRLLNAPAAVVTNCLIRDLSGTGIAADTSPVTLSRSLIYGCGRGLAVQGSAGFTNSNNTISGCLTGLQGTAMTAGNLIVWSNAVSVTNGPATMTYSDVEQPGTNRYAGAANLNRNPWFRDWQEGDYRLLDISPCRLAAGDGGDMGAAFPVGACPRAPAGLVLTNVTSAQIELRWQDASSDETGFEIQRSTDGAAWQTLTNVGANVTNFINTGLAQDSDYWYRVRAWHRRGRSLFSNVATTATAFDTTTQALQTYLRISEIMYNPPLPPPGSTNFGNDDFEFLELQNMGPSPLDLSGLRFTSGITFSFTNGTVLGTNAFFVLVRNPAAFASRYPGVTINDAYDDPGTKLANNGEKVRIADPANNEILDVTYQSGAANFRWYTAADGNGYSLVLVDPTADPNLASTWRASTAWGGSPGQADPSPSYGTIVINELLAHQDVDPPGDRIELFNAGSNSVNVGGWYLSDDPANLKRFQIQAGTVIPAGGYRVYAESTNFGTGAIGTNGFALSELGETLYLSSASNGVLTSYRTYVDFGATENGITLGRYTRSDGQLDFTALSSPTFGSSNAYPKVGPVVINEIMYNPAAGGKEFVELYNAAGSNVPLYDAANPSNTWRFDGAVEYAFPPGTVLAPREYALVVSVDPALFRTMFGLTNPALRVFGPFDGALANGGDTVKLYKPNAPEPSGFVPYVLADRVQYEDRAPWPTEADNGGPSLERIDPTRYGNDPTNWMAVTLGGTPGATNNATRRPSVAFAEPDGSGYEGNYTVNVRVSLWPASAATVSVQYAVSGGTATPGADFVCPSGTLVFWPYDTLKTIPLAVKDDALVEPDKTVEITLSQVSTNARLGGNSVYTYTIIDTDATSLPAPQIAPTGAAFTNYVLVTITAPPSVPGSAVRYTLNGARPSFADPLYLGPFALTESARVSARTFLGSYNAGDYASALFVAYTPTGPPPPVATNVWSGSVTASSDDAEQWDDPVESLNRVVVLTNATVSLGLTNSYASAAGFRFTGVGIPKGAVLTNAYVQFTSAGDNAGAVSLTINAQASDNAATFTADVSNITARAATTNSVVWSPAAWLNSTRDVPQRTPNLKNLVQEVVNRPGWATSNAVAFIIRYGASSDRRAARAWDGGGQQEATLYVEWSVSAPSHYYLAVFTNGSGCVSGGNLWVPAYSNAVVQAFPNTYYHFANWSGDIGGGVPTNPTLTVWMDRNRNLTANIPENLTSCGAPEWWLAQFYQTNSFAGVALGDTDGDGMNGCAEYTAGTSPTNPLSLLDLKRLASSTNALWVYWSSVTSRVYSVFRSGNLATGWPVQPLTSGMPGNVSGTNAYPDTTMPTPPVFYRIGVQKP